MPAVWIEAGARENAQGLGYTVVDASTVVATHLSSVIQAHAAELLGREETQALLDHLAKDAPKLVEDVVPKLVPLSTLQKILQNLLSEGVHIRDMRSVLECLQSMGIARRRRRTECCREGRAVARDPAADLPVGRATSKYSRWTRNWSKC